MHRVISPLSGRDRYSCAFSNDSPLDRMIECIPACPKPGEEPFREPSRVEDHPIKRNRQSHRAAGTELDQSGTGLDNVVINASCAYCLESASLYCNQFRVLDRLFSG